MKIKKYEVADMKEALRLIKQELGPDAVILTTKKVTKPAGLGLLSRQVLEVTAAVDYDKKPAKTKQTITPAVTPENPVIIRSPVQKIKTTKPIAPTIIPDDDIEDMPNPTYRLGAIPKPTPKPDLYNNDSLYNDSLLPRDDEELYIPPVTPTPSVSNVSASSPVTVESLAILFKSMGLDKISDIIDEVGELKKQLTDIKTTLDSPANINIDLPENLKEIYKLMVKNGMDELLAYRFLKSKELDLADVTGKAQLKNIILHELAAKIHVEKEYLTVLHNKVTMFIGPTGVGKTTTIAKIAAELVLKYNQRVCLITSDVFRIGAVEQLRTYAEIVSLPLYVATGADDLERIICDVSAEYDYILVDSTGRSPYDTAKIGSIGEKISVSPSIVPVLVLSMAANHAELVEIYDRYGFLEPQYLVFTKLDETRRFGAMANIVMKKNKPILLVSNGQGVPDDIETPDGKKIANKILQEISTLWKDN